MPGQGTVGSGLLHEHVQGGSGDPPPVQRFEQGDTIQYHSFTRRNPYVGTFDYWFTLVLPGGQPHEDIGPLVRILQPEVTEQEVPGSATRYSLAATHLGEVSAFADLEGVSNPQQSSFVASLDPRGYLERYRLHYVAVDSGTIVVITREVEFSAVGMTTVPPPEWYDRAVAQRNVTSSRPRNESNPTPHQAIPPFTDQRNFQLRV
jgi:hypothetical protein